ncbi:MAG: hypothetical protein WCX79_00745 [Candidatus Paceibacterota bacterium]|jgi:hypothetical protein
MTPKDADDLKQMDASIENHIRRIERLKTLKEVYDRLEGMSYQDFESGCKHAVVDWSDIDCLFAELGGEE